MPELALVSREPSQETSPDSLIMDYLEAGDPRAIELINRKYRPLLARAISRAGVTNPEDINDTIQETFIKILESHSFQRERVTQLGTWLFIIARNCASSLLRSRARHNGSNALAYSELAQDLYAIRAAEDRPDEKLFVEARRQQVRAELSEYLDALPPRQRAIIARLLDAKTPVTIAEELGIKVATVYSAKNKALETLRTL